jgi:hypothetical protein
LQLRQEQKRRKNKCLKIGMKIISQNQLLKVPSNIPL